MIERLIRRAWTVEEVKLLLQFKDTLTCTQLARLLNRNKSSITNKIKQLKKENGKGIERQLIDVPPLEGIRIVKLNYMLDSYEKAKQIYWDWRRDYIRGVKHFV